MPSLPTSSEASRKAKITSQESEGKLASDPLEASSSRQTPYMQNDSQLMRHPDFWFNDGSVVLVVQNTMFRVHKTFLSRNSPVFRDMFSLPQPPSSMAPLGSDSPQVKMIDEIEGCPVVRLHDSSDDVSNFLYALYDGPKFGNNGNADFRVAAGILRLATKYMIDSLRSKTLEHLNIAWPTTLKGWDAREEAMGNHVKSTNEPRCFPSPVDVINLAREVNAPSLLTSAFYDLSRYPLADIFDYGEHPSNSALNLRALSLHDTQKLVLGKESAHYAVTNLIRSFAVEARSNPVHTQHHNTNHASHGQATRGRMAARHRRSDSGHTSLYRCSSPATCWRDVCELVDIATQHYLFDRKRGARDPLYVADELAMLKGAGTDGNFSAGIAVGTGTEEDCESETCRACARAFEVWARREREKLWKSIPGWFRLD